MAARSKARKRALDILFSSELRSEKPLDALDRVQAEGEGELNPYTGELVRGVADHLGAIDKVLGQYAQGWSLERMPAVDRNVLRLGVYEILFAEDVPPAVAVSEALALVRDLSTDDSPTLVNGVLGAVVRDRDQLA